MPETYALLMLDWSSHFVKKARHPYERTDVSIIVSCGAKWSKCTEKLTEEIQLVQELLLAGTRALWIPDEEVWAVFTVGRLEEVLCIIRD